MSANSIALTSSVTVTDSSITRENCSSLRKSRSKKHKKSEQEMIQIFWSAPPEAFFSQETISVVTNRSIKTLECDRWRGKGICYRKCSGRVLYRKSDVIGWLEGCKLVSSTSEYDDGGDNHAA